jgi:hypothetical protein
MLTPIESSGYLAASPHKQYSQSGDWTRQIIEERPFEKLGAGLVQ